MPKKSKKNLPDMNRNTKVVVATSRRGVITDPAQRYYEQARQDRVEYAKAIKFESPWVDLLNEGNHEALGAVGNPRSREGFDSSTFRNRG